MNVYYVYHVYCHFYFLYNIVLLYKNSCFSTNYIIMKNNLKPSPDSGWDTIGRFAPLRKTNLIPVKKEKIF